MNIVEKTNNHLNKTIVGFFDSYGNELTDLHMREDIVIRFSDESEILLSLDWYGSECYISQKEHPTR